MNLNEARIKKTKEWFALGNEDLNIAKLSCDSLKNPSYRIGAYL